MGSVIPAGDSIPAMDPRRNPPKPIPTRPARLNRLTKTIVMVAGLVLIGGSAVGGIAFAASRASDSLPTHPRLNSSPGTDEDNNKQDSDHPSATPKASGTCTEDNDADDATTGEREGNPTTSRSPEADDVHHSGTATPTATGSHHPEATEAPEATKAPEANQTKDADDTGTASSCDD